MSDPFDLVCSRVKKLRTHGPDRARGDCPVCSDGKFKSIALSIGVTPEGAVLIHCFRSECAVDEIVAGLGLEIADLYPPRESHAGPLRRRRLLSADQALGLLHREAQQIAVAGANIAYGIKLTDDDRARCLAAAGRVASLLDEVRS